MIQCRKRLIAGYRVGPFQWKIVHKPLEHKQTTIYSQTDTPRPKGCWNWLYLNLANVAVSATPRK